MVLTSKSQKDLLALARTLVQPLRSSYYKGQAGKIAVFGGCADYTGAPFFAGHLAALVGADLSHIVCETQAATVIKLYSPDLMVHPYLYALDNPKVEQFALPDKLAKIRAQSLEQNVFSKDLDFIVDEHVMPAIATLVERIDVFVVGPGLGRDPLMLRTLVRVLEEIKVANKPVVVDADALFLVLMKPDIVKGYTRAVLSPNVVEFARICRALSIDDLDEVETARSVARELGVTVIRKGQHEIIASKDMYLVNDTEGSLRRVGGQGDTLAGSVATFVVWAQHYSAGFWEEPKMDASEAVLLACFAACTLVRVALKKAYEKRRRAMQTSDVHSFLGEAYHELFEPTHKM